MTSASWYNAVYSAVRHDAYLRVLRASCPAGHTRQRQPVLRASCKCSQHDLLCKWWYCNRRHARCDCGGADRLERCAAGGLHAGPSEACSGCKITHHDGPDPECIARYVCTVCSSDGVRCVKRSQYSGVAFAAMECTVCQQAFPCSLGAWRREPASPATATISQAI